MYKEDIVAGLKNTMDRGYTLEQAIQSFINAGYASEDVMDSAEALKSMPSLGMAVTAPRLEEKTKKPAEKSSASEEKPGFFKKMFSGRKVKDASPKKPQEIPESFDLPTPAPSPPPKPAAKYQLGLDSAEIGAMSSRDVARIKKIEHDLKNPHPLPLSQTKAAAPHPQVETTEILKLPKVAPTKVKFEKKELPAPKVHTLAHEKYEPKREITPVLGLPKTRQRRSSNAVFIILIVLLVMLLAALLFSFFYKDKLIEIIEKLMNRG